MTVFEEELLGREHGKLGEGEARQEFCVRTGGETATEDKLSVNSDLLKGRLKTVSK